MKQLIITGQTIELVKLEKQDLKGIYVDAIVRFDFYRGQFGEYSFILLKSKRNEMLKPMQYKQMIDRFGEVFQEPILFEFDKLESYQRNRFIERGVHFVVSDKYVFLPFLIINAKDTTTIAGEHLSPVAQYILLSQIQNDKFNNLSIKELEKLTPYKYVTLSRAIRVLEELELCESIVGSDRVKCLQFIAAKELWNKAQEYLINPIARIVYCSETNANIICSYNALSHYSNLNSDAYEQLAIYEKDYRNFENSSKDINEHEGAITVEVWMYPLIGNKYVDKLSLYLTLRDDKDPRVEKELNKMINDLW